MASYDGRARPRRRRSDAPPRRRPATASTGPNPRGSTPDAPGSASRRSSTPPLVAFGQKGFYKASLADVASAAGITAAGLLHHFKTKEALLVELLQQRDLVGLQETSGGELPRGRELLQHLVDTMARNMTSAVTTQMYAVLSAEGVTEAHPARDWFLDRYHRLRAADRHRADRGVADGDIDARGRGPRPPRRRSIAVMDGLQIQWLYDPDSVDMADVTCQMINALVRPAVPLVARAGTPLPGLIDTTPGRTRPDGSPHRFGAGLRLGLDHRHPRVPGRRARRPPAGRAVAGGASGRPPPGWATCRSSTGSPPTRPAVVGDAAVGEFGPRLPYLLKVLAAAQPLSLQAHPSRPRPRPDSLGRSRPGIDRAAPTRLYRDDWPKPEMLVALGDVEALCGFREPDQTYALFARLGVPAATELVGPLQGGGPEQLAGVFGESCGLAEGEREVVAQVVTAAAELLEAATPLADAELAPVRPDGGRAGRALPRRSRHAGGAADEPAGLRALRGLFLPAGNLHAYLHGIGVEIMANSDNVMRGGLTPKHVDVDELLAILDFTPGVPDLVDVVEPRRRGLAVSHAGAGVRPLAGGGRPTRGGAAGGRERPGGARGRGRRSRSPTVRAPPPLARGESVFGYPEETLTVSGTATVMVAAPGV